MSPSQRDAPGPKATELFAGELREQILSGSLAANTPLREEELAARSGLSRHTVRAALAVLAEERLVVSEAYRGSRVASFDTESAVGLQQLRGALEAEAVRMLHERHGSGWPAEVRAPILSAIADLARTEAQGDWLAVTRAHSAMHVALVEAAGSARITEAYRRLESETLLLITQLRINYPSGSLEQEHRAYLEAVQRGDTDAVRAHLAHTTELVRRATGGASGGAAGGITSGSAPR